jgi:uncharacterized protein (TIGR02186 family)
LVCIPILLAAPATLFSFPEDAAPEPLPARVTPAVIEVGSAYSGAQVEVRGEVRIGARVVVMVRGPVKEEVFNRKRRVGPIWINSGKVRISGVPSLLFRYASDPAGAWLSGDSLRSYQLDESSVMEHVRVDPPDPAADRLIRADYLAMKAQQGMYLFTDGGVLLAEYGGRRASFMATFQWPKNAPPATYEVGVYEILRGSVTRHSSVPLKVVEVGFPATIFDLATNKAPVYGALAVLVAVLAGFGIDFLATLLFGKRRAAR